MRIAIIGGGIYGTAIAYFLEQMDSSHEVLLFEKDSISGVSTGKSAGIVRHHYSDEIQIRFAKRGRELLERLPELVGSDGGFYQNGYLILAGESNEDQFRKNVRMQKDVGLDVEFVDPDELDSIVPGLDSDGVAVAALEHEAGFADPYLVATGFANQARTLGAEIRTNEPVTDLELADGSVETVETASDRYDVDVVVNAAGPWADDVAEMAGADLPLTMYEAKVVCLSSGNDLTDYPTVSDVDSGLYAKPELNGDFLSGGMEREGGHRSVDDRRSLGGVTNDDLEMVGQMLDDRLPRYADADVVDSWSEVITAPPDWHQIIGTPPTVDNFYIVAGGSGHGFKEAPGFAESIAETILGRKPTISLDRYRPTRFETGDAFSGGYGDGSRS